MLPSAWQITPILVIAISIFGFIGNLLCILILSRREMRSPHVYNLIGLSLSDIGLLFIAIFRTLDKLIPVPAWLISNSSVFFPVWIFNSGTKYFTVATAIERFIAVTFPFKYQVWMNLRRAKISAFGIFGFCLALTIWAYIHQSYVDEKSYSLYLVIILHFIPFVLVTIFNLLIFLGLRKYKRNRSHLSNEEAETESVTRMLFVVVMLFGICSLVEVIRRIWIFCDESFSKTSHYELIINHLTDTLYVLNSSANFVIYCICGTKFRQVFLKAFGCQNSKNGAGYSGAGASSATQSSVNNTVQEQIG